MRITYEPTIDALYIAFKDAKVTTKRLDDDVALDYGPDGTLAGIEVLSASERLHFDKKAPRVELRHIFAE